jgi:hypothetical protein
MPNRPPRRQPGGTEPVPQLCDGAIHAAKRLRHASRRFSRYARWSPAATAASWRRDGRAIAIIGHSSEIILRALTARAQILSSDPGMAAVLHHAADATARAWAAWRSVSGAWDTITTSRHPLMTPVAAEIGDLVLWTGRLAYRTPHWTPARSCQPQAREPATLAPSQRDLLDLLAAVHHVSDTVTRIGLADRSAIRQAAIDQRLHVTTRSRPADCDIPYPYAPAPRSRSRPCSAPTTTRSKPPRALPPCSMTSPSRWTAPSRLLASAHTAALTGRLAAGRQTSGPAGRRAPSHAEQTTLLPRLAEEAIRLLPTGEPAALLHAAATDQAAHALNAEAGIQKQRRAAALDLPAGSAGQMRSAATQLADRGSTRSLPRQYRPQQRHQGRR